MIKAILFDRDGVLIDSEDIHYQSVIYGLKQFNIICDKSEIIFINGLNPIDYKKQFIKKFNVDWEKYRDIQRKKYYEIVNSEQIIIKESVKLARKLKEKKFKIAMVTAAGIDSTKVVLKLLKMKDFFDFVVTKDDCEKRKPNPEAYLLASKELESDPKNCLVIEDSQVGLEAAKRAGMKCVIVRTNNTIKEDYSKADLILNQEDINFKNIEYLLK